MFKFKDAELDAQLDEGDRKELQFLDDLTRKIDDENFSTLHQVNLKNLKSYLINLLRFFSDDKISIADLSDAGEALNHYIYYCYNREYPDTSYPNPSEEESLSVDLNVLRQIEGFSEDFLMFPEDVPFFIKMLEAPAEQAKETNEKIYAYAEKFDRQKRFQEALDNGWFKSKIN